jgi:site-specific DNA recombinase
VWGLVSTLLRNPERLRAGLEEMIEKERAGTRGDPDREANAWLEKLSEVEQERRGYLRLAAKGHMDDDELGEALSELEETRVTAETELEAIRGRKATLEELERDRDALLESYAGMLPDALDNLAPEERRQVYLMLRLRVEVDADGHMEAQGILSENVRLCENEEALGKDSLCENRLASLSTTSPKRVA